MSGSLLTLRLGFGFGVRAALYRVWRFSIYFSDQMASYPLRSWFCLIIWRFGFALYILSLFYVVKLLFSSQLFSGLVSDVLGYEGNIGTSWGFIRLGINSTHPGTVPGYLHTGVGSSADDDPNRARSPGYDPDSLSMVSESRRVLSYD